MWQTHGEYPLCAGHTLGTSGWSLPCRAAVLLGGLQPLHNLPDECKLKAVTGALPRRAPKLVSGIAVDCPQEVT